MDTQFILLELSWASCKRDRQQDRRVCDLGAFLANFISNCDSFSHRYESLIEFVGQEGHLRNSNPPLPHPRFHFLWFRLLAVDLSPKILNGKISKKKRFISFKLHAALSSMM